jgi:hypothetical protein
MSGLYATVEPRGPEPPFAVVERPDAADRVAAVLAARLDELEAGTAAFRDSRQARRVLGLVFGRLLPAYREFHADLLEHQPPGGIERPFFVMTAAQAVLAAGGGEEVASDDEIVGRAIDRLNDYVGWRPVAVLENGRLSEPYRHERVRPVPLFVAGAGAAHGRYGDLVAAAVEILERAPEPLVRQADFDPALLAELAFDPRAFDFLHPAASRPNYLFGLWDPAVIDETGCFRRMVVQQVTLDGILSWPDAAAREAGGLPDERIAELRLESAAVLAGVVLMASGLCGHGPGAVASSLPLAELLPRIAGYRDAFYRWLLTTLPPDHRGRLEAEAELLRQPFGGVRRHINAVLAGRRARQVETVALAAVFARLGRSAAAERLAGMVPAASARMFSRMTSRFVAARRGGGRPPADAATALVELDAAADLLLRAVDCGAAVDPWNILGLAGQFPIHEPGGESLPDPRVDDLVDVTESILEGYASVWRQAALTGQDTVATRSQAALERLASWWDRFATTSVSGVPHVSGREILDSCRDVIAALRRRRTAAGPPPPGFWRKEVAGFSSPRSHSQAAEALLAEGDLEGAQGLLVHWASLLEGGEIGRTGGIWLSAAGRWLDLALADPSAEARDHVRRFLEFIDANTSAIVDLVELAAAGGPAAMQRLGREADDEDGPSTDEAFAAEESEADGEQVAAAYESMVWRDSTDDGVDGGMLDLDLPGGSAAISGPAVLEEAAEILTGTASLLARAVVAWCRRDAVDRTTPSRAELDAVVGWRHSLRRLRRALVGAAGAVASRETEPPPGMGAAEFDRLRWQQDVAAERLIEAAVQATETIWMLSARLRMTRPPARAADAGPGGVRRRPARGSREPTPVAPRGSLGGLFAAILTGDRTAAVRHLAAVRQRLEGRPVLYVPLARGGRPDRIARARSRERLLERLAACLPRLGLVAETAGIVQLAKSLESRRPPGAASVSEFDRVFEAATGSLVERIVETAAAGGASPGTETQRILDGLALLVPRLLEIWMTHARQLRLSVLERVRDDRAFASVREFVERYGSGLFTQQLLAPGSLRGILRGGVRRHLERLVERAEAEPFDEAFRGPPPAGELSERRPAARQPTRLIADLTSGALSWSQAAARLRLVLESVAENHAEYRDWNSTTTQSDRGECLHILLDFLRLKAEHDRIAWTLRPVSMAHRVLARRGAAAAAEAWRGRMRDETRDTATALVARLDDIERRSGVRLASVSDRVRRPFSAALEQDELEALVEPAARELVIGAPVGAGTRFETKAETFLGVASGSGVELPEWLDRLGVSVDRAIDRATLQTPAAGRSGGLEQARLPDAVPWLPMSWPALEAALGG